MVWYTGGMAREYHLSVGPETDDVAVRALKRYLETIPGVERVPHADGMVGTLAEARRVAGAAQFLFRHVDVSIMSVRKHVVNTGGKH